MRTERWKKVVGGFALGACLLGTGACGGAAQWTLMSSSSRDSAAWVIVLLVEKEDTLRGFESGELFGMRNELDSIDGVLERLFVDAVVSGSEESVVRRAAIEQEEAWIVAIAHFADDPACARRSAPVEKGSRKVRIELSNEDCLRLTVE